MITEIKIENFKSIASLTLKPGRVTVLIGENGSGKSNILEALAFGAGAAGNKLDREFLYSRGIRVTEDEWMRSAFTKSKTVSLTFNHSLHEPGLKFHIRAMHRKDGSFVQWSTSVFSGSGTRELVYSQGLTTQLRELVKQLESLDTHNLSEFDLKGLASLKDGIKEANALRVGSLAPLHGVTKMGLTDFLIYAPENTVLRAFDPEGAIEPLGSKGEGLLKLLGSFGQEQYRDRFAELNELLHTLNWFGDLALPDAADAIRDRIRVTDNLLPAERSIFDQRSANEGFLLLLFYYVLFLSWRTPKFFAIDNLDTALNPKLCATLMRQLAALAAKYDKQVIFTTHNPAVLDGLDLNDDAQRLFTVSRNDDGHTQVRRVTAPQPRPGERPIKLSEAFLRGLIGGLPNNF